MATLEKIQDKQIMAEKVEEVVQLLQEEQVEPFQQHLLQVQITLIMPEVAGGGRRWLVWPVAGGGRWLFIKINPKRKCRFCRKSWNRRNRRSFIFTRSNGLLWLWSVVPGGGGSGFVCTATSRPSSGYYVDSKYNLTNATTYAGSSSFTSTSGGTETGHSGNGYAKITLVSGTTTETIQTSTTVTGVRWNGILETANFDYGEKYIKETDMKNNVLEHRKINTVEYIEGTGTQWIDTGITASQNTRIELEVSFAENSSTYGVMGSRTDKDGIIYNMFMIKGDIRWDYYKSKTATSNSYAINNKVNIKQTDTQTTFTIGETTKTLSNSSTEFSIPYNIYLFSVNTAGKADSRCAKMKLYSFKIYIGTTLARDFVPVLDQSNVPCLYDKVSKTYFYNSGTGTFNY